jgi:hypothetical protein
MQEAKGMIELIPLLNLELNTGNTLGLGLLF